MLSRLSDAMTSSESAMAPPLNDCFRCLCVHTHKQRYVYYVIMYSAHVELAVSPVNAGHLVGAVSRCYT